MTQTVEGPETARRAPDPAREVVLSLSAIAGATVTYLVVIWAVVESSSFETTLWLAPVLYVATLAPAVVLRARSASRRRWAIVTLTGLLAVLLVPAAVILPYDGPGFSWEHRWLLDVSGQAAPLVLLTAWGAARRHGRWWWIGLVPAHAALQGSQRLQVVFVDRAPESTWTVGLWVLDVLAMLLGAAACWAVDLLVTRPVGGPRLAPPWQA